MLELPSRAESTKWVSRDICRSAASAKVETVPSIVAQGIVDFGSLLERAKASRYSWVFEDVSTAAQKSTDSSPPNSDAFSFQKTVDARPTVLQVLSMKRSQAINIGLTKLPPINVIPAAIMVCDSCPPCRDPSFECLEIRLNGAEQRRN